MRNHCYITPKDGDIYIEAPYDEEFLQVFKAAIPSSDREWEGDLKRWWVSGRYRSQAERICRSLFENVIEC